MFDLAHAWGADLSVDSNGGLAVCGGPSMANQRIYRRLLTNPGDYVWNLSYGGGLAKYVGSPAKGEEIEAVIRNQMLLEQSIAASPVPSISVDVGDMVDGMITANVLYTIAGLNLSAQLILEVTS